MTVLMLQYQVQDAHVTDVERGIREVMSAIAREQPAGVRYAMCRLPDGVTFVGLLELDDGVGNPLPGIAEASAFQQHLGTWVVAGPPVPQPLEVVGSYGLFS